MFSILHDERGNQRRPWHPTPVLLPGKSHGRRSLVGCSPWGCEELDTTERLHFHFSLSFIGEGTGNPLRCSCLENPRDGGAWWAAVYGVAQSRTRLKRLSSSVLMGREKMAIKLFGVETYFRFRSAKYEAANITINTINKRTSSCWALASCSNCLFFIFMTNL